MGSAADTTESLDSSRTLLVHAAAIRLIQSVLQVVPNSRQSVGNRKVSGNDEVISSSETRAYETINNVFKLVGSRILAARLVDMDALAAAITTATTQIEMKHHSPDVKQLFQSLARKLNDVALINSVIVTIYLVGLLCAELSVSLPNYKKEYPALVPLLVQQMVRVAVGEEAFRENLTANLLAHQAIATTAGLLLPTDIGCSIFPDFPSFSPTRYSGRSMLDRISSRNTFEKLIKHFDTYGFPQPLQGRDVDLIKDWRFLAGDHNTRSFEVEKADKEIGMNFGRVLYWLICSAHRMSSNMAVIAYHDQHIALIRFLGSQFGYRILNTTSDLNLSGPHLRLNKKLRATFDEWVVIMPSETLIAEKRLTSKNTAQCVNVPSTQTTDPIAASNPWRVSLPSTRAESITSAISVLPDITRDQPLLAYSNNSQVQFDGSPLSGVTLQNSPEVAGYLVASSEQEAVASTLPSTFSTSQFNMHTPAVDFSLFPVNGSTAASVPFSGPSVTRRKAPPPPKKIILAKVLYDFEAEEQGGEAEEELTLSEGDVVEIVEKSSALEIDGWCRARVQGQEKIGLVPLDYLEELPNQSARSSSGPSKLNSTSVNKQNMGNS